MKRSYLFEQTIRKLIKDCRTELRTIDAQIYNLTWWRKDMVIGKFRYEQQELFKLLKKRE